MLGITVTNEVIEHPFVFVYVIVVLPDVKLVTNPVFDMEATPTFEEIQGEEIAGEAEPVNWEVAPKQNVKVPEILINGKIVIVDVFKQPFISVKVIVTVPVAIPVTNPVDETVAFEVLDETQGEEIAGVEVVESWVVEPIQAVKVPVIIGVGFTITVTLSVATHPLPSIIEAV